MLTVILLLQYRLNTSTFFFFFNDTATTEIYTLSLHDALPISESSWLAKNSISLMPCGTWRSRPDRKSTRLNSSHSQISYAVFCLKKKKQKEVLGTHGKPRKLT